MSNTDANKCTLCGRRWTDPDYPHGVEGLERVGGVGWVPVDVAPAVGRSEARRNARERGWAE